MAVISCPNCQGKLRFPDDSPPRRVKCASCAHSFLAGPKGPLPDTGSSSSVNVTKKPASDSSSSSVARKKTELPPPKSKAPPPEEGFTFDEEDDRPRSKRRDDDEEDDDRPRKKRSRDDDEDDDRPKNKRRRDEEDDGEDRPKSRRRRDEEDEDDDDRPRKRRRRDEEDDDDRPRSRRRDEEDDRPKETKAQYGYARQGLGLAAIGFWCQVGALSVILFTIFLTVVAHEYVPELNIPAGLAGLANWILGCVGFSFLIAGPKKGNLFGLSIALIATAGIHLFLTLYISFQGESSVGYRGSSSSVNWQIIPTQLNEIVGIIVYDIFSKAVLLTAVVEIARFILFALVIKEYGRVTRTKEVSQSAQLLVIGMPVILGISMVLFFILRLIAKNSRMGSEGQYIFFFMVLLEFGGYIALYSMAALLCGKAKRYLYMKKKV